MGKLQAGERFDKVYSIYFKQNIIINKTLKKKKFK